MVAAENYRTNADDRRHRDRDRGYVIVHGLAFVSRGAVEALHVEVRTGSG
jgi:hypothetical protein